MQATTPEPVLSVRGIFKRFGAVEALCDVHLDVHAGEVVAVVGDNGAGKSTMIKVIAGVSPADAGEIRWDGRAVSIHKPADATALGIATVYQDLALCDNLDVVANLYLGRELTRRQLLDEVDMERAAAALLQTLAVHVPNLRAPVAALSGGQRQSVAIARSLLGDPRVVLLDEPTAALAAAQAEQVLDLIDRLRDRGHGVVMVSHNLAEVRAVADRVTVLRLGRVVGDFRLADTTQEQVVRAIAGAAQGATTRRPRASSDGANAQRGLLKDWSAADIQDR